MYPDKKNSQYGSFVHNFVNEFLSLGAEINNVVIKKKESNIKKIAAYIVYVIVCFWKVLFTRYDVIYVHYINHSLIPFIILKYFLKKPLILNAHGGDFFYETKGAEFIAKFTSKVIPYATKIVVPSNYFKEELIKRYHFIENKIFISPSGGVNLRKLKKRPQNVSLPLKIGYLGRIDLNKGWDTFINAVSLLKNDNIEVHIGGSGKELDKLEGLIRKNDVTNLVKLYGYIDHNKISDFFKRIDVLVFPSRRKGESLGLVPIEALACGVPVIANNNGAANDYLTDTVNGYIYNNDDMEQLKNKILKFKNLKANNKIEMSTAAIDSVKKYDSKNISLNLKSIIEKIINNA